ncbi:MAG: hypothetical protein IJ341_08230 [Bacteroidales bacterium]|nr:hypothetical protein [Bacteroidales bacterium]
MKSLKFLFVALALVMTSPLLTSCSEDEKETEILEPSNSIVGVWTRTLPQEEEGAILFTFNYDGTYKSFWNNGNTYSGTYSVSENIITFDNSSSEIFRIEDRDKLVFVSKIQGIPDDTFFRLQDSQNIVDSSFSELLPGNWACERDGVIYTVTYNEDGSFCEKEIRFNPQTQEWTEDVILGSYSARRDGKIEKLITAPENVEGKKSEYVLSFSDQELHILLNSGKEIKYFRQPDASKLMGEWEYKTSTVVHRLTFGEVKNLNSEFKYYVRVYNYNYRDGFWWLEEDESIKLPHNQNYECFLDYKNEKLNITLITASGNTFVYSYYLIFEGNDIIKTTNLGNDKNSIGKIETYKRTEEVFNPFVGYWLSANDAGKVIQQLHFSSTGYFTDKLWVDNREVGFGVEYFYDRGTYAFNNNEAKLTYTYTEGDVVCTESYIVKIDGNTLLFLVDEEIWIFNREDIPFEFDYSKPYK